MMYKVIITGSTGMLGKGVLLECLQSQEIDEVLVVNRRPLGMPHPKLKEIILADFLEIESIKDQLGGYDACFYSMGVSSVGMNEETYFKFTYSVAKAFADVLYEQNPEMIFIYVSGTGTDSSEKGRVMWARVKGKTENMILNKGFKDAYAFRPGVVLPEKGVSSSTGFYSLLYSLTRPLYPLFRRSKYVTTTSKFGKAMVNILASPREKKVLENKDINSIQY